MPGGGAGRARGDTVGAGSGTAARRHPDCAFKRIGDEGGLVVLPGRAEVKVVNDAGIRVFSMLDGTHTPEAIADAIVEEFDVTREQALADVRAFLDELAENGMLALDAPAEETPS